MVKNKSMKLENQVVSLDLAKQLKEAKYKQEGLWWWVYSPDMVEDSKGKYILSTKKILNQYEQKGFFTSNYVAPTVAELGEMLPNTGKISSVRINKWYCSEIDSNQVFEADTEADVRAKMWLYLNKKHQ